MRLAAGLAILAATALTAFAQEIDSFAYPDAASAAEAWRPVDGAPAPSPAPDGGLAFPVPFSTGLDRAYWDLDIALDLTDADSLELDLSCAEPSALRSLSLYFHSGDGWYIWNRPLSAAGRQRIILRKSDFQTEGTPAGWDQVDKVRLSPWKGQPRDTTLVLHRLAGRAERLYVVQATASAPDNERSAARRAADRISRFLGQAGLSHAVVTEDRLPDAARRASIIILPYNPSLPADGMAALESFHARGGKIVSFFNFDSRLATLMQVSLGSFTNTRDIARWRAMAFTDAAPSGLPPSIHQQSWNIGLAAPADTNTGRVAAWWADAAGHTSDEPALIATPAGYWFTHILLDDDSLAKQRMLTALLASLDESLWRDAADHALLNAGRIDSYPDAESAARDIERLAVGAPDEDTIAAFARRIRSLQPQMERQHARGEFRACVETGRQLTDTLIKAYSLVQSPVAGEMRGVWDHDGTGWYPGDWDRTARLMADAGINTLFVNATWAGLAHYPSKVLPSSFTFRHYGDQLEQCLRAARAHGLKVHAWIVCWYLENAPEEFLAEWRGTDRLQQSSRGAERLWMNPAHPDARKHHLDIIAEILENYDVDGIHLDYIRYPDSDACYSHYTRRAFEKITASEIARWPDDVRPGGALHAAFVQWRSGVITDFVRQSRELIDQKKPGVQLSAAVWGGYPQIVNSIGQDWHAWLRMGYVDFLCPMNYANELYGFTSLLDQQLALPGTAGKLFPGIGVTANESQLRGDKVIEQVLALRQRGVGGFVLFDLSQNLVDDTLPALRLGATRP